jgi:serine phosphatase RsbU (regulator of sigma subunit)
VLYTDGLVERRTRPLEEGLNRLAEIAGERRPSPDATCDAIVAQLLGDDPQMDDVAVLVMNVAAVTAL